MARQEIRDTSAALSAVFGNATFTVDQAAQCGVSASRLQSAARAGALVRLRKGHYRLAPVGLRPGTVDSSSAERGLTVEDALRLVDRLERLCQLGVPACVGERTAHGLWGGPSWGFHISAWPIVMVPHGWGLRRGVVGGVRIVERSIDSDHVLRHRFAGVAADLPIVDPLLASLQVAARPEMPIGARVASLHAGLRRQLSLSERVPDQGQHLSYLLADPQRRSALLAQAQTRATRMDIKGRQRLLAALAIADPRIESLLESISWAAFVAAELSLPEPQAAVLGASGREYRVDFLFGKNVIGECDGAIKYMDPKSLWREKKRQEDLEQAGFVVVRWTWEEIVHHPEVVVARITSALDRA